MGNTIASNLPSVDGMCSARFLGIDALILCSWNLFTQAQVVDVINKIPSNKAPGWDGLSSFVVKIAYFVQAEPFAFLFNKSISLEQFPDNLKRGKVVPVHKGWSRHDLTNYRSITVLPVFAKLFGKLRFSRVITF